MNRKEVNRNDTASLDKSKRNTLTYWKKANGVDEFVNHSDDGDSQNEKNALNYVNPMMQITKSNFGMRDVKKKTAILRHDIKKEYNFILNIKSCPSLSNSL